MKKKGKKRKKPSRPPPKDPAVSLNAGPMADEALLERYRGGRERPVAEREPLSKKEAAKGYFRRYWDWMFETEIHSPRESTERDITLLLFFLLPVVLFSEFLIPKIFSLLFGWRLNL